VHHERALASLGRAHKHRRVAGVFVQLQVDVGRRLVDALPGEAVFLRRDGSFLGLVLGGSFESVSVRLRPVEDLLSPGPPVPSRVGLPILGI